MKYPNILLLRNKEYEAIDKFFTEIHKNELLCNVNITSDVNDLNKLFNPNYPLLITYGDLSKYIFISKVIPDRFRKRWLHYDENKLPNINVFNNSVNYCFMHNIKNIANNQIAFSLFTTCYKSFDKIKRAYNSIKTQTFLDWEWVILDDTPNDTCANKGHFDFLKSLFENDHRIRLYKRSDNDGNIGNVKNEAVLLCRGKYVLEMDHDDELLPYTLEYAYEAFESDKDVGFVYMNFANVYENGNNFKYSDHYSLGYAGYYCQKYGNKWLYVSSSANINDITLSHIVAIPNHPRIWRKDFLINIGNYSELLPISDDYELFIRTALSGTKIVKINELGYIQYMNDGNNNFSLIRNSEINRLCTEHIYPHYREDILNSNSINAVKDNNPGCRQIWKLGNDYEHKYGNIIYCNRGEKQVVFIGFETFLSKIEKGFVIQPNIDYIVLDNTVSNDTITTNLDFYHLSNFKCYSMTDCSEEQLVNYFKLILQNGSGNYELIYRDTYFIKPTIYQEKPDTNEMIKTKITLITPSIRPENLVEIEKNLDFAYIDKWVIVYDMKKIKENPKLFERNPKIIELMHFDDKSRSGNAQRNCGLDFVKDDDTFIYFLDDDNLIHPDLYKILSTTLETNKIYTFDQKRDPKYFPYVDVLKGNIPEVFKIDSGMLLIYNKLIGNARWEIDKYNSDGIFIKKCIMNNADKWIYINKILSNYNII